MANAGLPPEHWDMGLVEAGGHFLQSRLWAEFQGNLGRQVVWETGSGWRWMAALNHGKHLNYLYAPYGPTVQTGLEEALGSLVAAATELECDLVRTEPRGRIDQDVLSGRATLVKEVQPQHTSVLDLNPDLELIRKGMAEGHRYSVGAAPKRGVVVRISENPGDIEIFWSMMEATAERASFDSHPHDYFEKLASTLMPSGTAKLYLADAEDGPVASAIAIDFNRVRYYLFAAAFAERSRRVFAGVYLCWQMISDAKEHGMSSFDFWGVAPAGADEDHRWAGLSQFKRSFGGHDVETLGTWDIPLGSSRSKLQGLLRKIK